MQLYESRHGRQSVAKREAYRSTTLTARPILTSPPGNQQLES